MIGSIDSVIMSRPNQHEWLGSIAAQANHTRMERSGPD